MISAFSCADHRLDDAGGRLGAARAGIVLPDLPEDCRRQEPHAELVVGAEVRTVLRRERSALDRQNARGGRCAGFYDDVKAGVAR